jgi:hypothetical protein
MARLMTGLQAEGKICIAHAMQAYKEVSTLFALLLISKLDASGIFLSRPLYPRVKCPG